MEKDIFEICKNNDIESLTKLLDGDFKDINSLNADGESLLHIACFHNFTEIAKLLISKNINVNLLDKNNCTALFKAAEYGNVEIMQLMLKKDVDFNIKNNNNEHALFYAKDEETARFLMESGSDFNFVDKYKNFKLDINNIYIVNDKSVKGGKTCIVCRETCINYILANIEEMCPICYEMCDKVYAYSCGHINCCETCFELV